MRLALHLLIASFGAALAIAEPPLADDPKLPTNPIVATPEAKTRFDALIAAYRALPAYADHGEVVVVTQVNGQPTRRVTMASIAFVRPDMLDVETEFVRVLSDGKLVTEVNLPLKKYRVTPAPHPFREAMIRGGPLGSVEFGGMAGLPLAHVLNLVIGHEPERLIADFAPKLVVEPDQEVGGTTYQVLRFDEADNHDWRFLIDPKTGLIAHVDLAIEGAAAQSSIAGPTVHVASIRWSAGEIKTTPPEPTVFQYHAPEGFTGVAPLESNKGAEK